VRLLPKRLQERADPLIRRTGTFVRDFEWTWTKAVLVSLLLWFLAIGFMAMLPSWWLYFADQKLGWHPCPCPSAFKFWLFKLRDVVASGLYGTVFLFFIVIPFVLQKWRRRLRSESESRPTGGYR
jgi:hypothetical protein